MKFFKRLPVKGKELIYIVVALIIGIVIGTIIINNNYNYNYLGTAADWASAIMSFIAIIIVFWQMRREAQNERAFYIENKRPHFSVERTTVIHRDERILYDEGYIDLKTLYEELHGNKSKYIVRLTNISDNIVQSLKIKIDYNGSGTNRYAFDGLFPKQSILLVTDDIIVGGLDPLEIWIKFKTTANEIGYFHFGADLNNNFTKYFFVKGQEPVSVYGNDLLLSKNNYLIRKIEKKFKKKSSYKNITIPKEEFEDLEEEIGEKKN